MDVSKDNVQPVVLVDLHSLIIDWTGIEDDDLPAHLEDLQWRGKHAKILRRWGYRVADGELSRGSCIAWELLPARLVLSPRYVTSCSHQLLACPGRWLGGKAVGNVESQKVALA